jgi:hypothetical protein
MAKKVAGKSFDEYKPVKNPLDPHSCYDGCMIETFEPQYDLVRKQWYRNKKCIWTVLDGEGSGLVVVSGLHFVNRMGYIITEIPWESETIEFDEHDKRVSN